MNVNDPKPVSGVRIEPLRLIREIVALAASRDYLEELQAGMAESGLTGAVTDRDQTALFGWLIKSFSYHGISDRIAADYIDTHGNACFTVIKKDLAAPLPCPKLVDFESYRGCGYRKTGQTCGNRSALAKCPVPKAPLRKGGLNETAVSLYLYLRDVCGGDLVGHIDRLLADADLPGHPDRLARMRSALTTSFGRIAGISDKLITMALSHLMMGGGADRPRWLETGASMITVDTLVHNFLVRSGILHRTKAVHVYGPICYGAMGCAGLIDGLAREIDAREINPAFPVYFPRLVQFAIWRFCTQAELGWCNGIEIDDSARCRQRECPLHAGCGRVPLRPS